MDFNNFSVRFKFFFNELCEIFDSEKLSLEQKKERLQKLEETLNKDKDFLFVKIFVESFKIKIY